MKRTVYQIFITALFLVLTTGAAQAQFSVWGEFKTRGEYRDGYQSLRDSSKTPYADILGRARIYFDYKTEHITTRFSLQQAFVYGQNNFSSDTIAKNTVNIYEAWFKYNFTKNFGVKLGRVELQYDDNRFIGASNWSMWGATHDLVLAQWEAPACKYKGDFGFAINNLAPAGAYLSSYNLKTNYKYMGYLYEYKSFLNEKLKFSLFAMVDAFQKNATSSTKSTTKKDTLAVFDSTGSVIGHTIISTITKTTTTTEYPKLLYARGTVALDGWLTLKKFSAFATGAYQGGHYKDGRKIQSWFYAAWVSYQFAKPFGLKIGYDHLSGNNFSDTTKLKSTVSGFSTLYGTNHQHYGYMDIFNTMVRDNLSAGLNDLYARATLTFTDKMSVEATWRWFSLPNGYLSATPTKKAPLPYQSVDKSLGHEIDLMYVYKPIPNLELNAAYCFFLQTNTMEILSNIQVDKSKFANYAYIMITYKPNFFSTEKK